MTLSMWLNPQGGTATRWPLAKFWGTTMTSPVYQYGLELDGGTTPHFYIGTAAGLTGAAMGSALPRGAVEPSGRCGRQRVGHAST